VFCELPGIRDFAVSPGKQGSGVGKALMTRVIAEARSHRVNIGLAGAAGKFSKICVERSLSSQTDS